MSDALRHIAIVHYHLKPGGVTTVVKNAVQALGLREGNRVTVISGERDEHEMSILTNQRTVAGLGYGAEAGLSAERLTDRLVAAARAGSGGAEPDLWHFHNHSLGKNPLLPDVVRHLLDRGARVLLQVHDFAEDGRPDNFAIASRAAVLYPCHPRAHYAVLNHRDEHFLREAGPELRVHYLPNPVPPVDDGRKRSRRFPSKPLIVYPTRGIRRKNLGEVAFWAALFNDRAQWVTTRRPANRAWQGVHDAWSAFARRHRLPLVFGVVDTQSPRSLAGKESPETSYRAWLGAADAIVTTSVAEGFGLAFLEPTMLGLPLLGRDLPDVTSGFGLSGQGLYRALRFPLPWVGRDEIKQALGRSLTEFYARYGRVMPPSAPAEALEAMLDPAGEAIDFGRLDETMQRRAIEHILAHPAEGERVTVDTAEGAVPARAWFERLFQSEAWRQEAARHVAPVQERFSLEAYAGRLMECYTALQQSPEGGPVSTNAIGDKLLDRFLDPGRFHFLRC